FSTFWQRGALSSAQPFELVFGFPISFSLKMIYLRIEASVRDAVVCLFPDCNPADVRVQPCQDKRFGDYQCTSLMGLAKSRRLNPREVAGQVLADLDVSRWCEAPVVAGPGFLNFKLRAAAVTEAIRLEHGSGGSFYSTADRPRTIVIDFSSPNVAKTMHVGHIRSTILGDCLARVNRLLGHRVITDNHIGDWGTQFGKLLVGWKRMLDEAALRERPLDELERLYKAVNALCESDQAVLEEARQELVKLQQGDSSNLEIWRRMISISRERFDVIYARLGVVFDHTLGESYYNSSLDGVVTDLSGLGLVRESEGALVAFFEGRDDLRAHPAIVRKSDGAANYTTTDLATLKYRCDEWGPDDIIYVTDGRQQLHFRQLFALFDAWRPGADVRLHHVWFGSILGEDGKPFKTRSGETVRLEDLLDEAEERAFAVVCEKNSDLGEAERREIARIIGLGAVKYADLLPSRQTDYVFSWEKMLALNGNTAPYLQYAYTRIQGIFRKAGLDGVFSAEGLPGAAELTEPAELELAKQLMNYGLVLRMVADEQRPNLLCNYLYEVAGHFARFFEQCPVLKAEESVRAMRLVLCEMTGRVLRGGLNALGIETSERM
ncbi:MAG: arginine--tRNA ligase, partial [Limisphaerales bacterium]